VNLACVLGKFELSFLHLLQVIFFQSAEIFLGIRWQLNWKHIHEYLRRHENSPQHLKNYFQWFDMCKRLDAGNTIDQELQHAIVKGRDYWKVILYRSCSIVLYLSKYNLAFRGENDKLCTTNNGNFLGLVELPSKYDVTMHEHVRRNVSKGTSVCYCSKTIQNEIISVMASCVRDNILERARKAKYFSIILNCTQNLSHREQMKGYKPEVTNLPNCKKLVRHFIQLSKQRFILCQTWLAVKPTVQFCNLVNFSGTKNKGYFIFNFTLKYLSFSMLLVR
jgi:hypothetical protein